MSAVTLYQGEALETMATMPAQSVNAIITDLPYGTTACKWDEIIPFAPMWAQVKRVLKPRGVFVTTASQPFTSLLIVSNLAWFKYEWIWDKYLPSGFLDANIKPLKAHENICVFSDGAHNYFPQKAKGKPNHSKGRGYGTSSSIYGGYEIAAGKDAHGDSKFPKSVLQIDKLHPSLSVHPTQKPVALYKYLILTYTNPGDVVLDFCAGSGTTGVAAIDTGRDCILVEKEPKYVEIIRRRIATAQMSPRLEGL